ncbi:MAG: aminotransferase class I/II-fold pyridoxal phosphate-dependent enzyme, partial [Pseudomonadota bacterium]
DHIKVWRTADVDLVQAREPLNELDSADVVVICNPNNPDGRRYDPDRLQHASAQLAARGGWLIVDEAYADLDPDTSLAPLAGAPGLIILRSTGKFFGLAGLRLGAVLAPSTVNDALEQLLGQWRLSGIALALGSAAYVDSDWQQATRARLSDARARLDEIVLRSGVRIAGGTDLFRLLELPDAHSTWARLCQHGIYTRRFDWSKTLLRIGLPPTPADEARVATALLLEGQG